MQKHLRTLIPMALALVVALAGCKTTSQTQTEAAMQESQEAQTSTSSGPASPSAGASAGTDSTPRSSTQAAAPAGASRVEFYLAQTNPGEGMTEVVLPDGKLYLQPEPVLTRSDLAEVAAVVDRQGNHFVGLSFTELGAHRLAEVSRNNIGSLMALVIDRQLVAAPRIAEPLSRGVLMFGTPDAESASRIAQAIRGSQAPAAVPSSPSPSSPAAPGTR